VRVNVKAKLRALADLLYEVVDGLSGHRPAFAEEQIRGMCIRSLVSFSEPGTKRPEFVTINWLVSGKASFFPADKQPAGVRVDILETGVDQFGDPKPVPVGHENQEIVACPVPTLAGCLQETLHLSLG
jgi:hypothetical protein